MHPAGKGAASSLPGNAYIGAPTMKDYTIECDLQGTHVGDKERGFHLPEMGIVANRYTLLLAGNIQKLRLVSWDPLPRIDKTINYAWKPGVWYRLKLTVEIRGDTADVRGKVWERGQKEPEAWTIGLIDPRANTEGAPALFGDVTRLKVRAEIDACAAQLGYVRN